MLPHNTNVRHDRKPISNGHFLGKWPWCKQDTLQVCSFGDSVSVMECLSWKLLSLTYRLHCILIKCVFLGPDFQTRGTSGHHVSNHPLCNRLRIVVVLPLIAIVHCLKQRGVHSSNIPFSVLLSYLDFHTFVLDGHCVVALVAADLTFRTDANSVSPAVNLKSVRESVAAPNLYLPTENQRQVLVSG